MSSKQSIKLLALGTLIVLGGCRADSQDGPPSIRYGDSVCDECGMIISDERFATSSVIVSDRGPHPTLFDDFNCQVIFEHTKPQVVVLQRWSHDYVSSSWIDTKASWFVYSETIKSPMASNSAAFEHKAEAEKFAAESNGVVYQFDELKAQFISN